MPSFFFHLSVDLLEKSPSLGNIAEANKHILSYQRTVINPKKKLSSQVQSTSEGERECSRSKDEEFNSPASKQAALEPSENAEPLLDLERGEQREAFQDWRCGTIFFQTVDMVASTHGGDNEAPQQSNTPPERKSDGSDSRGLFTVPGGLATKGKFEPLGSNEEELGWGVVRLYRDACETPGLYDAPSAASKTSKHSKGIRGGKHGQQYGKQEALTFKDEDCTTLCILAVPSYLTPSDFLGFVGEKTREEVSHFRMIRTEKSNRYMVLMKFRDGRKAREWRKEWNGRLFNDMEVSYP